MKKIIDTCKMNLLVLILAVCSGISWVFYMQVPPYVDAQGVLHERFAFMVVGFFFTLLAVLVYMLKLTPHLLRFIRNRSQKKNKTMLLLFVACLIVSASIFSVFLFSNHTKKVADTVNPSMVPVTQGKVFRESTDFYDIEINYPKESRDKDDVMGRYLNHILEEKKTAWVEGGEAYTAEKKIAKDFPDRPLMRYQLMSSYKTYTSEKRGTISYVFMTYEYTGGAHGMTSLATFTFNEKGQVMIDDVLTLSDNNNDIKLSKMLAEKLEKNLGDMKDSSMIHDGLGLSYLKDDGVTFDREKCRCDGFFYGSNFQNFFVTNEGITFMMGQYQVAPYAAGMPEVLFTWEELKNFSK